MPRFLEREYVTRTRERSPIPVLTFPDVEPLHWSRPTSYHYSKSRHCSSVRCWKICFFYHPQMRYDDVFSRVCLSATPFEALTYKVFGLKVPWIFRIIRSSGHVKVTGSRSKSQRRKSRKSHLAAPSVTNFGSVSHSNCSDGKFISITWASFKRSLNFFLFQSAYGCETRVSWLL